MLVEMAIGDAIGAAFEFIPLERWSSAGLINDATFHKNPDFDIGNGRYTDDTQMTLAIAELMVGVDDTKLENGDNIFTTNTIAWDGLSREDLGEKFVRVFKRDVRNGYAKGFFELLKTIKDGPELLAALKPTSIKSGACMRAGPLGLYNNVQMVLNQAKNQAIITHDTPEGIASAQAVALMTHYFVYYRYGEDKAPMPVEGLGQWIETILPDYGWSSEWAGWVSGHGMDCAHAAISTLSRSKSYREVLERCIALGGDVDTVAAIAMFAASLTNLPNDLPLELYQNLENEKFGLRHLATMDGQLKLFARMNGALLY